MKRLGHDAPIRTKQRTATINRKSNIVIIPGSTPYIDYGPPPEYVWAYRFYEVQNIVYYPIFF